MARVTDQDVIAILGDTNIADLTPFIDIASLVIDQVAEMCGDYSVELLTEMEKWLAAHFATAQEREPTKIRIGDSEESYNWNTELGLGSSEFGKRLAMMDYNGCLTALTKPNKIKVICETMLTLPGEA